MFSAAGTLATDDPLASARSALSENLPLIALHKLQSVPASPEASLLRAEAQITANQPDAALATLAPLLGSGDARAALLNAQALARKGRWADARIAFDRIVKQPAPPLAAHIGLAESSQASGDTAGAIAVLEPLMNQPDVPVSIRLRLASLHVEAGQGARARKLLANLKPTQPADKLWVRYLEGRLSLLDGQPAAARSAFTELLNTHTNLSENLFVAATLGAVEARIALQGPEAADNELETFIWRNPDSAWLDLVFSRLDQIYAAERNPQEAELQKWSKKSQPRRAALAQYYLCRMQVRGRKWDKALISIETFLRSYPGHQFGASVLLLRADVQIEKGDLNAAVRALEAAARIAGTNQTLRGEIELRTGLVELRQREFVLAANSFDLAAARSGPASKVALYDSALAWLNQPNYERFFETYRRLGERGASGDLRGNLILEEGLSRARLRDPEARETLRRFVDQFPSHPRVAEARLADAELSFANRRLTEASQLLKAANEKSAPAEVDDHEAYLAIFLADAKKSHDDAELIRLAKDFIRGRPKSALLPEVRMKLGQVYFRQPDYPNAETQFATLAQESPQSPYVETALFLAGQAAMRTINTGSTERALGYFDEVVKQAGPLKLHAREQQAIIQNALGKQAEAIALYDVILTAKPPADPELRAAALIGKGDTLMTLSRNDPPQVEAAIVAFSELAADQEATASRRYQALYEKGRALDQAGRKIEAVATFNEALDQNLAGAQREFFWFYKSGFEAARHYEQQSAWPAAIAIYEKMARVEGPRAEEAQRQAKQLRLEHFVWD